MRKKYDILLSLNYGRNDFKKNWQIAGASPDPDGTFVERFLHEIGEEEKNKNKRESSFTGESGRAHLRAQLQDMFIAGLLVSQINSFF